MSFLDQIFARLEASATQTLLTELRESGPMPVTGLGLLAKIARARAFLSGRGLKQGDRVALLAANGIQYFVVNVPQWASRATNTLLFADQFGTATPLPVSVFFDQTTFPPPVSNPPILGPASSGTVGRSWMGKPFP